MDKAQVQQVLEKIGQIKGLNIPELVASFYPDADDIANVIISKATTSQFTTLSLKVLNQLENELRDGLGELLPWQYNYQNEYGSDSIINDLANYQTFLQQGSLQNAETHLFKLAYYQVANGFFDKSTIRQHNLRGLNLQETTDIQDLRESHLDNQKQKIEELFAALQAAKTSLTAFHEQKKTELQQVTDNLQASTQNTAQIATLLNHATASGSKIDALEERFTKALADAQKTYSEYKTENESEKKKIAALLIELDERLNRYNEHLNSVEEKKAFFDERNQYLTDLIGREVGASLFETFKQRKIELEKPVEFWKWAVPIVGAITILGIYAIFTNFFGFIANSSGLEGWQLLALNSLKSAPMIYLLVFVSRQYSIERHFQEEYAFKSAVALTIQAYTEQLQDVENKDKLIMESVEKIYQAPFQSKSKPSREKESGKDITETVKNLSEAVKEGMKK